MKQAKVDSRNNCKKTKYRHLFFFILFAIVFFIVLVIRTEFPSLSQSILRKNQPAKENGKIVEGGTKWKSAKFETVFALTEELEAGLPQMIRTDRNGHLYVLDYANHQVLKFDSSGRFLLKWGRRGKGPGEFHVPARLFVDRADRIVVVDWSSGRVSYFSAEGHFEHIVRLRGMTPNVGFLSNENVVAFSLFPQEPLWYEYDRAGTVRNKFGRHLTASHLVNQGRLEVDENDHLFYSYDYLSAIVVYDRGGTLLLTIDGPTSISPPKEALTNPNYQLTGYEPFGSLDLSIDGNYLYVLFSGLAPLQARMRGQEPVESDIIHVYNKSSGEYLYSYRLPVLAKYIHVRIPYVYCVTHNPVVSVIKYRVVQRD